MDAQTNPLLREAKNSSDTDWVEHVHTDGSKYYHNIITAKTQWEKPAEFSKIPSPNATVTATSNVSNKVVASQPVDEAVSWEEHEHTDGSRYYHNNATGATQWHTPKEYIDTKGRKVAGGLDEGEWSEHADQFSGKKYYVNSKTGETQWHHPHYNRDGERSWDIHTDDASGRVYYANKHTGETRWAKPPELSASSDEESSEEDSESEEERERQRAEQEETRRLNEEKRKANLANKMKSFKDQAKNQLKKAQAARALKLKVDKDIFHGIKKGYISKSSASMKRRKIHRIRAKWDEIHERYIPLKDDKSEGGIFAGQQYDIVEGKKDEMPAFDEDSEVAFILNVFKYVGTVFEQLKWQLVFTLLNWLAANLVAYFTKYVTTSDFTIAVGNYGKVIAFLLAFRVNEAYFAFNDGRFSLDAILSSAREVVAHIQGHQEVDDAPLEEFEDSKKEVVRLVNLQFGLMRQALREANDGFTPHCGIEGKPFDEYWHLDPVEPRVANLMTRREFETLKSIPPAIRPTYIQTRLYKITHYLSGFQEMPGQFTNRMIDHQMRMMDAFKSCVRIVETPVPVPYRHLIGLLAFTYVYGLPWIYAGKEHESRTFFSDHPAAAKFLGGWIEAFLYTIGYMGVIILAQNLQNPFGYDRLDLDLAKYAVEVHDETTGIWNACIPEISQRRMHVRGDEALKTLETRRYPPNEALVFITLDSNVHSVVAKVRQEGEPESREVNTIEENYNGEKKAGHGRKFLGETAKARFSERRKRQMAENVGKEEVLPTSRSILEGKSVVAEVNQNAESCPGGDTFVEKQDGDNKGSQPRKFSGELAKERYSARKIAQVNQGAESCSGGDTFVEKQDGDNKGSPQKKIPGELAKERYSARKMRHREQRAVEEEGKDENLGS